MEDRILAEDPLANLPISASRVGETARTFANGFQHGAMAQRDAAVGSSPSERSRAWKLGHGAWAMDSLWREVVQSLQLGKPLSR